MIKDYTFSSAYGECKYVFKNNYYCFTATSISNKTLGLKIGKTILTSGIFSTEGDIMDTCRGLVDILMVGDVDYSYITNLYKFDDRDMLLPNFLGNYHSCLLENTPWTDDMVEKICSMFSKKAAKYFRDMIKIFVDAGDQVILYPLAVKEVA